MMTKTTTRFTTWKNTKTGVTFSYVFIIIRPLNYKILNKREKQRRFGCNQLPFFKSKEKEEK